MQTAMLHKEQCHTENKQTF